MNYKEMTQSDRAKFDMFMAAAIDGLIGSLTDSTPENVARVARQYAEEAMTELARDDL